MENVSTVFSTANIQCRGYVYKSSTKSPYCLWDVNTIHCQSKLVYTTPVERKHKGTSRLQEHVLCGSHTNLILYLVCSICTSVSILWQGIVLLVCHAALNIYDCLASVLSLLIYDIVLFNCVLFCDL